MYDTTQPIFLDGMLRILFEIYILKYFNGRNKYKIYIFQPNMYILNYKCKI